MTYTNDERKETLKFRKELNDHLFELIKQGKISTDRIAVYNQQMNNTQRSTLRNRIAEKDTV